MFASPLAAVFNCSSVRRSRSSIACAGLVVTKDAKGNTKQNKFQDSGELIEVTIYAYKVEDGKIVTGTTVA